jgi:hypothetical protein
MRTGLIFDASSEEQVLLSYCWRVESLPADAIASRDVAHRHNADADVVMSRDVADALERHECVSFVREHSDGVLLSGEDA